MVIRDTYEKAGITYSVKKSYWEPRFIIEHIGFVWDFTENVIRITPKRLNKVPGNSVGEGERRGG